MTFFCYDSMRDAEDAVTGVAHNAFREASPRPTAPLKSA